MLDNGYSIYTTNSTTVEGKAAMVAKLFIKTGVHIRDAIKAIEAKDPEARYNASEKARIILITLQSNLERDSTDQKVQGLVKVLDAFYLRMCFFITQMNLRNDPKIGEVIIHAMQEMALSFNKVQKQVDDKKTIEKSVEIGVSVSPQPPLNMSETA